MIVCPSCGSCIKGDLCLGCPSCGARAIGPPLAKAEHELPSFGRAAIAFASGVAMLGTFLGLLIAVFIEKKPGSLGFWTIATAGEIVAWRVKWVAIPVVVLGLWASARIARSIKRDRTRFIGLRAARIGLMATWLVAVLLAALIGITIPERLRQRQDGIEAASKARGYTLHRAFQEYLELHGTYPTDRDKWVEALRTLPDPDGSIADALNFVDPGGYEASAKLASTTKVKPLVARGVALRSSSTTTNPEPASVSFTSYELRIPSERRFLGPDEDFILSDGVIKKASEVSSSSSASPRKQ